MRKIDVSLTIGFSGADRSDTLEVEDDATDEDIEEVVREWAFNFIEFYWKEVK